MFGWFARRQPLPVVRLPKDVSSWRDGHTFSVRSLERVLSQGIALPSDVVQAKSVVEQLRELLANTPDALKFGGVEGILASRRGDLSPYTIDVLLELRVLEGALARFERN